MVRFIIGATSMILVLCCTAALAEPRDDGSFRLPPQLEGRARVVKIQTPPAAEPGAIARDGMAEWEAPLHPADMVVEVLNDEAVARGVTASGPEYEAVVFNQPYDSGFGWFLDNTPGSVQWHRMFPGLGFRDASDSLSSFVARVYVSTYNFGAFDGTGGFTMELWDGDPLGVQDTTCSAGGIPAPIPGTTCTFTDLPEGIAYDLKCVFPSKIPMPGGCDRVFGVVWPNEVCRWSWRLSDGYITGGSSYRPTVGAGDAMGMVYACEQYGACATPSGYNAGVCCDDVSGDPGEVACDHTAMDPGAWIPDGGCNPTGAAWHWHPTFCQDDAADYVAAHGDEAPVYYNNFVGQLLASTDIAVKVVPVSVDGPPPNVPSDVTISGNTVTIDQSYPGGERHLWFELRVSDWDPDMEGWTLKGWSTTLDSSGYTAGLACTLTPWRPFCTDDVDCIAAQGPVGAGDLKGGCNVATVPPNECAAGFADDQRSDWVFFGHGPLGWVDQSTLDYEYGATLLGLPIPSDHSGDKYLGTLTLRTTCDCPAGNFYVGLGLPNRGSLLKDGNGQFIPMLGVQRADVIFPAGQCCNLSASPAECISDTVTRCECERLGIEGGFDVYFDPSKTCADTCCDCIWDEACADGDACTVNRCVDSCFCETTPIEVGPGACCDDTPYDSFADISGLGAVVSNDDGNPCTADLCDDPGTCGVGDQCGVPYNPALPAGTVCYDEELCLTVFDQCDGAGNCVGTPISSVPCTSDADCASITSDLASCNPATGFCECPPHIRVPTVSEWGLIVMGLLLLGGAKVYFNRRRSARA
jgi:hypothetical protein